MSVKKVNIYKDIKLENLNSIKTFFRFTKLQYFKGTKVSNGLVGQLPTGGTYLTL